MPTVSPAEVAVALDTLVEEIAERRLLPPIAAQVLQIAEEAHFSAHELALAISSDPALTSLVLRLSNSSYFAFPCRIATVRDAVVLLGFRQVWSLVVAVSIMRALDVPDGMKARQFWRHAVAVGLAAETLARAERTHTGNAFAAGFLHNIGRLVLGHLLPSVLQELRAHAAREGIGIHRAERDLLGFTDAELGGVLASRWHLPDDLVGAISGHADVDLNFDQDSLASLVARARAAVEAEGITDSVEPGAALAGPRIGFDDALSTDEGLAALLGRVETFLEHSGVA